VATELKRVRLSRATTLKEIAALKPDYERLGHATGNRLPFVLHEWHLTWCEQVMNCDPRVHEEPLFHVLRDTDGACVAILPFIVNERRLGPLRFVSIAFLGGDPALTEIRTPLIAPGFEDLAAKAARDALANREDWDWIHWTGLEPAFADALKSQGELKWQPSVADFVLDLPPTWEEFRARLKRNIRESLRHGYNSLRRDGHKFSLEVLGAADDVGAAIDRFLALHRMRAEVRGHAVHADRFDSHVSRAFLVAVCERLATRGVLRLFALKVGDEIVAMRIGFVVGDALYLYYSGFDPRWWRYGVMTTTVAEAIKYAIAHRLKSVNLSPGWDIPKARWSPRQVDYAAAFELRGGLRSRMINGAYLKARAQQGSGRLLQRIVGPRRWV
jgi:CelD/BcsL family acetyltransferase involved in cellulose biosynthesis